MSKADLFKEIDERSRLAGTNRLELLLFSLGVDLETGRNETYGINVFKVKEVLLVPEITAAPEMPESIEGFVSLRGILVPVLNVASFLKIKTKDIPKILIVTEYNGNTQGFLVEAVDTILRLDWSQIKVPPALCAANQGGLVTAVTELPDKRLVMLLDVEKMLAEATPELNNDLIFMGVEKVEDKTKTVFYVDDSSVARSQIEKTLSAMGVNGISAINGLSAWEKLEAIAASAIANNKTVKEEIQLILTDVEMPEMDGYLLTKNIKTDSRFNGIPVVMHSSLSGTSNQGLGKSVGVDEYVSKFEPQKLSQAISRLLNR